MKKILIRILGIIFVLFIGYQQVCYADAIDVSDVLFIPLYFLVGFIAVIVLVISAISFFALKSTVNKQNGVDYDKEKLNSLSEEEITKNKNKIQKRVYLCDMILSILLLIYLGINYEISMITFFIPIFLFVISIIIGLNKKLSNKICVISVALVCIIGLWRVASDKIVENQIIENQNKQLLYFEDIVSCYSDSQSGVSNVKGLIKLVIENNRSNRKVTLIYQNKNYTSVNELKQLLSELDANKKYSMKIEEGFNYIETISLDTYENEILRNILDILSYYEGNNQGASRVRKIFEEKLNSLPSAWYENVELNVVYVDGINQIRMVSFKSQEIADLIQEIKDDKTYTVKIQTDSQDTGYIIITCNN